MAVLRNKVLGDAASEISNTGIGLPLEQLLRMSLESLLRLMSILEKLNKEVGFSRGGTWHVSEALADWPRGFHGYLRRMADDGIAAGVQAIGLRKRFEKLYCALFKTRVKLDGIDFLREEFVRFGLDEWGEAVVDIKLLRAGPSNPRFISSAALASRVGVRPITVRRWIDQGAIPSRTVQVGDSRHYVVDAAAVDQLPRRNGDRLQARAAGKMIGVPVSVLRELKRTGHYAANPIANCRTGYWPMDLKLLTERLLATKTRPADSADDDYSDSGEVISLDRILGFKKLGVKKAKGAFLAEVLDGRIFPVGHSGDTVASLMFRVEEVEAFRVKYAVSSDREFISAAAAASMLGTGVHVVPALVAAGHVLRDLNCRTGVSKASVEDFLKVWRPLSALAKELRTSTVALLAQAERQGVRVMRLACNATLETPFLAAADLQTLRIAISLAHPTAEV